MKDRYGINPQRERVRESREVRKLQSSRVNEEKNTTRSIMVTVKSATTRRLYLHLSLPICMIFLSEARLHEIVESPITSAPVKEMTEERSRRSSGRVDEDCSFRRNISRAGGNKFCGVYTPAVSGF